MSDGPIYVRKIEFEDRFVWFRSRVRMPTEKELQKWLRLYREQARSRGPKNPLIIDVESDHLRSIA